MNDKKQKNYETPTVEVLTVRMELEFLNGTNNPVTVDQYDPWQSEDI